MSENQLIICLAQADSLKCPVMLQINNDGHISLLHSDIYRLLHDHRALLLNGVQLREGKDHKKGGSCRLKELELPQGIPGRRFYHHNGLTVFSFHNNFYLTADPDFHKIEKQLNFKSDPRLKALTEVDYKLLSGSTARLHYRLISTQRDILKESAYLKLHAQGIHRLSIDPYQQTIHHVLQDGLAVELSGHQYKLNKSPGTVKKLPDISPPLATFETASVAFLTDKHGRLFFLIPDLCLKTEINEKLSFSPAERYNIGTTDESGITTFDVSFCDPNINSAYRRMRLAVKFMVLYRGLHHQTGTEPILKTITELFHVPVQVSAAQKAAV